MKGFARAADRGAITGNGPSGGVSGGGKNVLIRGLPAKLTHDELREHLRGFQLAPEDRGQRVVVKLDMWVCLLLSWRLVLNTLRRDGAMGYSVTSRHFVKMGTESEAYRLVRKWHMMPFLPQQNGDRYIVRAQIIH